MADWQSQELLRMDRKRALALYLTGSLGQVYLTCLAVWLLGRIGIATGYSSFAGWTAIGIGGTSSALWGIVTVNKYKGISLKTVLRDFFYIKQGPVDYLLVFTFLALNFVYVLIGGQFKINIWYLPLALFLKALVFGGIEEIGWRYAFQPIIEEKVPYIIATVLTFMTWGIWHFAFFYIDGSLGDMSVATGSHFSLSLLVNSFVLSALYHKTNSLWICAMTHAMINVCSQLAVGGNQFVLYGCQAIILVLAILLSMKNKHQPSLL